MAMNTESCKLDVDGECRHFPCKSHLLKLFPNFLHFEHPSEQAILQWRRTKFFWVSALHFTSRMVFIHHWPCRPPSFFIYIYQSFLRFVTYSLHDFNKWRNWFYSWPPSNFWISSNCPKKTNHLILSLGPWSLHSPKPTQ